MLFVLLQLLTICGLANRIGLRRGQAPDFLHLRFLQFWRRIGFNLWRNYTQHRTPAHWLVLQFHDPRVLVTDDLVEFLDLVLPGLDLVLRSLDLILCGLEQCPDLVVRRGGLDSTGRSMGFGMGMCRVGMLFHAVVLMYGMGMFGIRGSRDAV